ncbi:26S protease regulatory subunit 6B [Fusarium coicis]|nr:26S protease regulatory subunit 6B [Fusarium coicis]
MGDVAVENPANQVAPHKRAAHSAIPTIDNFEGVSTDGGDDYANLKKLQRQLEYIQLQEEYIKDEQR